VTPPELTAVAASSGASTGVSKPRFAAASSISKEAGQPVQSLPVTGTSAQVELLVAGLAIALGTLLVLLSKSQRRARRSVFTP